MNDAECDALVAAIREQQGFFSRNGLLLLPFLLCVAPLFGLLSGNGLSAIIESLSQPFYWASLPIILVFLWLHRSIRDYLRRSATEFEGWLLHDRGMSTVRSAQSVDLEWKLISNWRVLEEGLLVEVPGGVNLVPRSGFSDERDWQRACALFQDKVQGRH